MNFKVNYLISFCWMFSNSFELKVTPQNLHREYLRQSLIVWGNFSRQRWDDTVGSTSCKTLIVASVGSSLSSILTAFFCDQIPWDYLSGQNKPNSVSLQCFYLLHSASPIVHKVLVVPLLMGGLVFWKGIPVSLPVSYPEIPSQ